MRLLLAKLSYFALYEQRLTWTARIKIHCEMIKIIHNPIKVNNNPLTGFPNLRMTYLSDYIGAKVYFNYIMSRYNKLAGLTH